MRTLGGSCVESEVLLGEKAFLLFVPEEEATGQEGSLGRWESRQSHQE